jgi:hypothetical protein
MKTVIIVDPIVSGNGFAGLANNRGYRCVQAWSSLERFKDMVKAINFPLYDDLLINHAPAAIEYQVAKYHDIAAIVQGSDTGLATAEFLDSLFKIGKQASPTQGQYLARYDRWMLTRLLEEPCALAESESQLLEFRTKHGKIVIKPRKSFGGYDRVTVSDAQKNDKIQPVSGFFAQPFLEGTEYAVDMVSYRGQHKLCAVWRYIKWPNSIANQRQELVIFDEEPELCQRMYDYVANALDKCEYAFGASHFEIMDTSDGVRLVEANFRSHGHVDLKTAWQVFKQPQMLVWVDAILEDKFEPGLRYETLKRCHRILITNTKARKGKDIAEFVAHLEKQKTTSKIWLQQSPHEDIPVDDYTWRNIMINAHIVGADRNLLLFDEQHMRNLLA